MSVQQLSTAKTDNRDSVSVARYMRELGQRAREASRQIAAADTATKNQALLAIADALDNAQQIGSLNEANQADLAAGRNNDLAAPLLDRLELTPPRITAMIAGLRDIAALADPVGDISDLSFRPSGIQVGRMRVPLGVIGIIYESRPNVTADAAALCLKAGNAAILRGGSEAIHSNRAIAQCIQSGLHTSGLSADIVQVVNTTDRAAVGELIRMTDYVDVLVPRGGKGLIERISSDAKVPVIKHLDGVCHVYIDAEADLEKARAVAVNAKCRRYGICGAMETLLVSAAVAERVLPQLGEDFTNAGIELRACETSRQWLQAKAASEDDWYAEFLGPILAVRVVSDLDQAIAHIGTYGSHHTDSIVTESYSHARRFLREVDSSSVMVNTSTQFADGYEYGLGAEIGISTDKLHARGPVGLEGLTTQKFIVLGDGHCRP